MNNASQKYVSHKICLIKKNNNIRGILDGVIKIGFNLHKSTKYCYSNKKLWVSLYVEF